MSSSSTDAADQPGVKESSDSADAANPPGGTDVMLKIAHYGLLAGLCQFIPLPFADDAAEEFVKKHMITQLLRRRERGITAENVPALYKGIRRSLLGRGLGFAKSIILKPIKKVLRTVFFWLLIRRAVLEAAETLLLGHTIDRLLAAGHFDDDHDDTRRRGKAEHVFQAVAGAWGSADWKAIQRLIRKSGRLLRPGRDDQRPVREGDAGDVPKEIPLPDDQRERLDSAAADLRNRLATPEAKSALARFDADVDRRLAALAGEA